MARRGADGGQRVADRVARWRRPAGVVAAPVDDQELEARLAALGDAGQRASALDAAAVEAARGLSGLSPLTSALAENYVERIGRPLRDLDFDAASMLVTRGYAAHLAVEAQPSAYGAADVPVIGTLPPARNGRVPPDLLTRVLRATRRGFERVRAVDGDVWAGFVACSTRRVHRVASETEAYVDPVVVDALLRLGWILRQVDLHYGQHPDRG